MWSLDDESPDSPGSNNPSEFLVNFYKFCLEFAFKVLAIFFAVTGGVLTLLFGPGQEARASGHRLERFFLIIAFLMSLVMLAGFGLATALWMRLWREVRVRARWGRLPPPSSPKGRGKNRVSVFDLVIRIYAPSLPYMLGVITALFVVITVLLGRLMAQHNVWFCEDCWLGGVNQVKAIPPLLPLSIIFYFLVLLLVGRLSKRPSTAQSAALLSPFGKWLRRTFRRAK